VRGTKIILTAERIEHITRKHPEVKPYIELVIETVEKTDILMEGELGEIKALKFYQSLHIGSKYMVVPYREGEDEGFIITAYFTSSIDKVRGKIIWRKQK
jgi:hypothetical protein